MFVFSTVLTVVMAALCIFTGYAALPAISLASAGFWWFLVLCTACLAISVSMFLRSADYDDAAGWVFVAPGVVLVALLVCGISSGMLFHSEKAKAVADITVSEVEIKEDFKNLADSENLEDLPMVDLNTARMLGDRKVDALKNASWYDVDDEYNLIRYHGKLYRLSVVDYGGYFKYRRAKYEGLPGYILVDATMEDGKVSQEASLVQLEQPIRYSPGAYFSYDLKRHLRSQFAHYIFDKSFLEIDESGTPYWVTGILRPTAGAFGVKTVTSFILTNAQTGEQKEYQISEAPEWIDHIFSLDYLMDVADWHYAFVNGFWSSVFSKTGVWCTSYSYRETHDNEADSEAGKFANFFGYSSVVSKDGQIQFYTGLTAANNAESNLGWLVIDTSSGKMIQYDVVGAEESSAQAAVEQLVQQYKYEATFPIPANIGGEPSYIMCLKGKAGLVQGYGICNMENYSIAVQAETLDEAITLYQRKLSGDVSDVVDAVNPDPILNADPIPEELPSTSTMARKTGTIEAIYTAEISGNTYFYYQIDGGLYRAAITVNERQVTFKVGEEVVYSFYDTENNDIPQITAISISPN